MAKKKICRNCKHYFPNWPKDWCLYHDMETDEHSWCDWWEEQEDEA